MDIIFSVVSFCIGCFLGYLTAYMKKKGENRALTEDIAKLTDEKQNVISKYESRLEDQKKLHTLEIEKRKYKYEEKNRQFSKYFKLLDEFNRKGNKLFVEDIQPIMNHFFASYVASETNGDKKSANKAIAKFMSEIQIITSKLNEEHLSIKSETNTLRLVSSAEMDTILDELDVALAESFDTSMELLKALAIPEIFRDPESINPYQEKMLASGSIVKEKRQALMDLMKKELDEI